MAGIVERVIVVADNLSRPSPRSFWRFSFGVPNLTGKRWCAADLLANHDVMTPKLVPSNAPGLGMDWRPILCVTQINPSLFRLKVAARNQFALPGQADTRSVAPP